MTLPGLFGVFFYRRANPSTLAAESGTQVAVPMRSIEPIPADLFDPLTRYERIDVLVNSAGIGFTMALFINALSFPAADFPAMEAAGKIGTLTGSAVSAIAGAVLLTLALRRVPVQRTAA